MKKFLGLLGISMISLLIIAGCAKNTTVRTWDIVTLVYTATFSDGTPFDQNSTEKPLVFTVWIWQTIKWLDEGIIWAKIGQQLPLTITPDKWYGALYDARNIQKISQLIFDKQWLTPAQWKTIKLWDIEGVVKWSETDESGNVLVLLDINPRQTRDTLTYTVTVLSKK